MSSLTAPRTAEQRQQAIINSIEAELLAEKAKWEKQRTEQLTLLRQAYAQALAMVGDGQKKAAAFLESETAGAEASAAAWERAAATAEQRHRMAIAESHSAALLSPAAIAADDALYRSFVNAAAGDAHRKAVVGSDGAASVRSSSGSRRGRRSSSNLGGPCGCCSSGPATVSTPCAVPSVTYQPIATASASAVRHTETTGCSGFVCSSSGCASNASPAGSRSGRSGSRGSSRSRSASRRGAPSRAPAEVCGRCGQHGHGRSPSADASTSCATTFSPAAVTGEDGEAVPVVSSFAAHPSGYKHTAPPPEASNPHITRVAQAKEAATRPRMSAYYGPRAYDAAAAAKDPKTGVVREQDLPRVRQEGPPQLTSVVRTTTVVERADAEAAAVTGEADARVRAAAAASRLRAARAAAGKTAAEAAQAAARRGHQAGARQRTVREAESLMRLMEAVDKGSVRPAAAAVAAPSSYEHGAGGAAGVPPVRIPAEEEEATAAATAALFAGHAYPVGSAYPTTQADAGAATESGTASAAAAVAAAAKAHGALMQGLQDGGAATSIQLPGLAPNFVSGVAPAPLRGGFPLVGGGTGVPPAAAGRGGPLHDRLDMLAAGYLEAPLPKGAYLDEEDDAAGGVVYGEDEEGDSFAAAFAAALAAERDAAAAL